jgi:hypothetical protein
MEVWKDINGYEGIYKVSDLGNVKSLSRKNSIKDRLLKPYLTGSKRKYRTFKLYKDNNHKGYKASQLVAIAFLNHKLCGFKKVVDHIDNNPINDNLNNLQIISTRQNIIKDMDRGVSKYLGVTFNKNANKYRAYYRHKSKQHHLGYFNNETEAHQAYKEFIKDKLI